MHFWLCKRTVIAASVVPPSAVEVLGFILVQKNPLKSLMTAKSSWETNHKPEDLSYAALRVI